MESVEEERGAVEEAGNRDGAALRGMRCGRQLKTAAEIDARVPLTASEASRSALLPKAMHGQHAARAHDLTAAEFSQQPQRCASHSRCSPASAGVTASIAGRAAGCALIAASYVGSVSTRGCVADVSLSSARAIA